jgi:hypothetical protein
MLATAFRAAAYFYHQQGWAAMPLVNDTQGFPKRPFVEGWDKFEHGDWEFFRHLPWERAAGLGLVLGTGSHNLAVLDVDDVEMGALAIELCAKTRRIETIRHRAHIYFIEEQPSASRKFTVAWHGRDVTIELKTNGTQVAAPPTPGYQQRCPPDLMPVVVSSIGAAWTALAAQLGVQAADTRTEKTQPWLTKVSKDHRNSTIFIEAHRLREAGVHYDAAVTMLQARWEQDYERGDQSWQEVERTIRSAYRKPTLIGVSDGRDTYQLWRGRLPRDAGGTEQ